MTEKKMDLTAGGKTMNIKELDAEIAKIAAGTEINLFHVEKQAEYDGIVMGVLENGTPYLSEKGLAKLCGIARSVLGELAASWSEARLRPRGKSIDQKLKEAGYTEPNLFIRCEVNGIPTNAYTEPVCMALLEYYAFDAASPTDAAIRAFRKLAKLSFRRFVYEGVGYSPEAKFLSNWRYWADRVDVVENAVPAGYYCVFSEIAPIIVPLIRAGLIITDKVIPDISVGMLWSKLWVKEGYDEKFGKRQQFLHNYPEYYRQALSNPQKVYVYPESSLPVFRAWLRTYVEGKFPKYLLDKVKQHAISQESAAAAIESFRSTPPAIAR
jgi:hypothetical protein